MREDGLPPSIILAFSRAVVAITGQKTGLALGAFVGASVGAVMNMDAAILDNIPARDLYLCKPMFILSGVVGSLCVSPLLILSQAIVEEATHPEEKERRSAAWGAACDLFRKNGVSIAIIGGLAGASPGVALCAVAGAVTCAITEYAVCSLVRIGCVRSAPHP
ncbi:MAG: hypothetical protein EB059_03760 [Alphaproteobacteria bacterium]|nr:hypothetical protein [Alphaproteobacteria bacterium]